MPSSRAARTALAVSTSATASWKDAQTSSTGIGLLSRSCCSTQRATAVFKPEKEKSNLGSRGPVRPRGNLMAVGSPRCAALSMGGPPGYGRPMILATLS
jgi:hypothetical protein